MELASSLHELLSYVQLEKRSTGVDYTRERFGTADTRDGLIAIFLHATSLQHAASLSDTEPQGALRKVSPYPFSRRFFTLASIKKEVSCQYLTALFPRVILCSTYCLEKSLWIFRFFLPPAHAVHSVVKTRDFRDVYPSLRADLPIKSLTLIFFF